MKTIVKLLGASMILTVGLLATSCGNNIDVKFAGRTGLALSPSGEVLALVNSCGENISEIRVGRLQAGVEGSKFTSVVNLHQDDPGTPTYLTFTVPVAGKTAAIEHVEGWGIEMVEAAPAVHSTWISVQGSSVKSKINTGRAEAFLGQIWALGPDEVFIGGQRQKMSRLDFFNCDVPTPSSDPELEESYGPTDRYEISPTDYRQVPWRETPPR